MWLLSQGGIGMDLRKQLTNEKLTQNFDNSFDLVAHAIHLAQQMIKSGHPIEGMGEVRNQACQILTKIARGEEEILPIIEEEEESVIVEHRSPLKEPHTTQMA